ncbi:hypothetical protein B0H10DRAFT_1946255 [Mycena sp. CBHHK59/15]|nr:hypothetical protein B0H10DRAFT_1946255 [Mycena sp. CBHHK59/15]
MLLSQPAGESDLDAVKSVISGATYIAPDGDNVKAELEETALATRNGGRKEFKSSGSGHRKPVHHAAHSSGDEGPAHCVADMPKEIKGWVLHRPGTNEWSNNIYEMYCNNKECRCHDDSDDSSVDNDGIVDEAFL